MQLVHCDPYLRGGKLLCDDKLEACAYPLADEISTGLDSATITDAMHVFRMAIDSFKSTAIVSLLQPPPEVYELFDNIMLMREGRIVYHGAWATGCCQCRVVSLLVMPVTPAV